MPFTIRVHRVLEKEGTLVFPGVYDALGAKLVEQAGFPLTFISGYSVAATQLGLPDFGYLTQTEMVAVAKRVCGAVAIPIIIDADTGYGNALNVIRTVNELIDAGAAGMFLEDQVWPKRCGHMKGKRVIPGEEQAEKIRAAVDARRGRDFFIVARTDARQVNGLDDAIERCRRYKEAGADALFVEAPRSLEELETVGKALPPPLVANMLEGGVTPLLTKTELQRLGFHLAVCPLTALYASAKAMRDMFDVIKTATTTREALDRLLPFEQFHPPTQEATAVKPWRNAERVSAEALAKADMLRRVPPKKSNQRDHGCKAVGLHKIIELDAHYALDAHYRTHERGEA